MREVYNSLLKKLNQYYQENNPNRILRRNILGMGILYCLSSNIGKIKILFDIFSIDDKFIKNEELDDFLLTLFILSSYAIIAARTKVAKSSNKFKLLSNNELKETIGTSELADCEKLLQVFLIKNNLLIMNLKINLMFKIMDLDGFLFLKVLD